MSFDRRSLILLPNDLHRFTDFLTFLNVFLGKGQQLLVQFFILNREGTDLGTNVFVSLFPDGHSNYKIDLGAHESCDRVSY